jgi:hypothetical protein
MLDDSSLSGIDFPQGTFEQLTSGVGSLLDHCPSVPPRRVRHTFGTFRRLDLRKTSNGPSQSADGKSAYLWNFRKLHYVLGCLMTFLRIVIRARGLSVQHSETASGGASIARQQEMKADLWVET